MSAQSIPKTSLTSAETPQRREVGKGRKIAMFGESSIKDFCQVLQVPIAKQWYPLSLVFATLIGKGR